MSFNLNQFKQTPQVGSLDLTTNPNPAVMSVLYNPTDTTTSVVPGEGVKITDLGANDVPGPPIVAKRSDDTEAIIGVRVFNTQTGEIQGGEIMTIAMRGAVVFMKAAAAIARGAKVSLVQATPGEVQAQGTKAYLGYLLDKAAATGDIVRVMIDADAVTAGS